MRPEPAPAPGITLPDDGVALRGGEQGDPGEAAAEGGGSSKGAQWAGQEQEVLRENCFS